MKNIVISLWKDYGLCINLLWHISYTIKLWHNDTKEGFDEGLVQLRKRCGFNYGDVGKNLVASGNQGGAFMAPWKKWETHLKCWLVCLCDSFGYVSKGLCGFGSRVFMLHGVTTSPHRKVCSYLVLQQYFTYFL